MLKQDSSRAARRSIWVVLSVLALLAAMAVPVTASPKPAGFLTDQDPFITLDPALPSGAEQRPVVRYRFRKRRGCDRPHGGQLPAFLP